MGASISSNVYKISNRCNVKNSNEVVQTAHATNNQQYCFDVNNTSGDVVISGNTIRQTATINMVGTFSSFE